MQPGRLIETLLALPGVTVLPAQVARVHQDGGQWQALDAAGRELARADTMILANAAGARGVLDASGLLEPWLPRVAQMHALAGEVTLLPAAALEGGPRCIIGGEGYLLPDTGEGLRGRQHLCPRRGTGADQRRGAAGHVGQGRRLAGRRRSGLECADARQPARLGGVAGGSARPPARRGELAHAPGLWMAAGYASRGLSWSALMGDLIGARLMGEPSPLERDLAGLVTPR